MLTISCQDTSFSNIQAVIFDKDGTLEDSAPFLRELALKRTRLIDAQIPGIGEPLLMAFGIEDDTLDPTGLMAVGSRTENEIAAAAYIAETGRSWLESKAIAHSAFAQADQYLKDADTFPFTGVSEFLKSLSKAGLKLGILSADSTAQVREFVERHQLSPYIQAILGVEQSGPTKPDPALFKQVCQSLGVSPQSTLMVGDSQGDLEMAREAGAAGVIGIYWKKPNAAHLKADAVISKLDEIQITNADPSP